jgi:lipid A 4'-phosphatase
MKDRRRRYLRQRRAWRKAVDWIKTHPITVVLIYVAAVSLFFLVLPDVDLWASNLFYSEAEGFWAQNDPFLRRLRHLGPHIVQIIAVVCMLTLFLKLLIPGRGPILPLRAPLFLLTTLILGPGVLVNLILKNNWGRPRPHTVDQFGGDLPYQPVWLPTDLCDTNCSFVSGEASAGIWLVAAVFIAPAAWRLALLCFVLPLALILSLNRIAFGGHFLSDTLISWGLTLLVILVAYRFFYVTTPRALDDRSLDEWFTRRGRILNVVLSRLSTRAMASARRFLGMFFDQR